MFECVVWTLITAGTLRLGPHTQYNLFYKENVCVCVGRDKSGFSKDKSRRDGWHFRVAEQGREISILSQLRTELVCHLT